MSGEFKSEGKSYNKHIMRTVGYILVYKIKNHFTLSYRKKIISLRLNGSYLTLSEVAS